MKTTNNSEEMKTQVQTYIIEETQELIYDNEQLDKWNKLVSELGLKGQTTIVQEKKSPIPFLCLNQVQKNILQNLCPREAEVSEYDLTPIPVEILDLISLSKKEGYFQKIEIWYDEKQKDPACVGITGYYYESTWYDNSNKELKNLEFKSKEECINAGAKRPAFSEEKFYILGRWADVKEDFVQLAKRAKERFIGEKKNNIQEEMKKCERELEDLEQDAFKLFNC